MRAHTHTQYHSAVKLAAFSWYLWWLAEGNSSSSHPEPWKRWFLSYLENLLSRIRSKTSRKSLPSLTLIWRQQQILKFSVPSTLRQDVTILLFYKYRGWASYRQIKKTTQNTTYKRQKNSRSLEVLSSLNKPVRSYIIFAILFSKLYLPPNRLHRK